MSFGIRDNISYMENQIKAHENALAEYKANDTELNEVLIRCKENGLEVEITYNIRPNSSWLETHGVYMQVYQAASTNWECRVGSFRDSHIFQRDTLGEIIEKLVGKLLNQD